MQTRTTKQTTTNELPPLEVLSIKTKIRLRGVIENAEEDGEFHHIPNPIKCKALTYLIYQLDLDFDLDNVKEGLVKLMLQLNEIMMKTESDAERRMLHSSFELVHRQLEFYNDLIFYNARYHTL